jgi:hypothetical protein
LFWSEPCVSGVLTGPRRLPGADKVENHSQASLGKLSDAEITPDLLGFLCCFVLFFMVLGIEK